MMNKRDINKLRTPENLEMKYNLNDILKLKENYELQKNGLNKVENELNSFVVATGKNLKELQDQVDGNITTWFYSGVPTSDNEPTKNWTTDNEKNNHLGDLYYDKETGYAYRYSLDNDVYSWIKITDNDVTQALAIANSAKDTADSKRRVFVVQPTVPYDCGDLWIKEEELYRCQIAKTKDENFEETDWIKATKYTDDTKANKVGDDLTVLSGSVLEIKNNVDEHSVKIQQTVTAVDELGNTIGEIERNTATLGVKQNEITAEIERLNSDGVEKLRNTLVTIDIEGIKVATNLSKVSTLMTNNTFAIKDNTGKYLAFFGYDESEKKSKAEMDNLTISNYFTAGYHRTEKFVTDDGELRTGCFYNV